MLNVAVIGNQANSWIADLRAARPTDRFEADGDWPDPDAVTAAVISVPNAAALPRYRNLRFIQSLWMGVDGLLADPGLSPDLMLSRMVDPGMPASMAETVNAYVLWTHRSGDVYQRNQRARLWDDRPQPLAPDRTVTVLGLGTLGSYCARRLAGLGFRTLGWSRSASPVEGIEVTDNLATALGRGEIVVNLLPLTPSTRGILGATAFAAMPKESVLINVGRGAHVVDDDLLAALDSGHVRHAVLDVFTAEPLVPDHPYWTHPRVTVTPHVAADSMPETCVPVVAGNLRRFDEGLPPENVVDRARGY
jgi:glyoxylate/hydroxypyruvate reductase